MRRGEAIGIFRKSIIISIYSCGNELAPTFQRMTRPSRRVSPTIMGRDFADVALDTHGTIFGINSIKVYHFLAFFRFWTTRILNLLIK